MEVGGRASPISRLASTQTAEGALLFWGFAIEGRFPCPRVRIFRLIFDMRIRRERALRDYCELGSAAFAGDHSHDRKNSEPRIENSAREVAHTLL